MDEEDRIEHDISELKKNDLGIAILYVKNKKDYFIDIILNSSIFESIREKIEIKYLMVLKADFYPNFPPRIYCLTPFCEPQLSDGRDFLKDIIKCPWHPNIYLSNILHAIIVFTREYYMNKNMIYVGNYYLGEKYDLKFFEHSNHSFFSIKENVLINGKWTKVPRLLFISDLYFCLYEQDKKFKNKLTLVFWAFVKSIGVIKKILVDKAFFIHWTQKDTEPYEMHLSGDKRDDIVKQLVNIMNWYGMNYNVTKEIKGQPPKEIDPNEDNQITGENMEEEGEQEEVKIETIEEEIVKIEALLALPNQEEILEETLQGLYQYYVFAEKYYETLDPDKSVIYKTKKDDLVKIHSNDNNNN